MRYGYFDSEIVGTDSEGMPIFDRAETSELFRLLFSKLLTNGVLAKPADCFRVLAGDTGLSVKVRPGFGLINGAFAYDAAETVYELPAAPTSYARVDRVILRCNYLERLCEIIVRAGVPGPNPAPPELIRPVAGDYFELCLATVRVSPNQTVVTQSVITDTRADSSVCGYVTQLIDSIDTSVFFAQFKAFYDEFVAKSNASYDQFQDMATQAFKSYTDAIDDYLAKLTAKGNNDLQDITGALKEFQRTSQNSFNAWFANVKDQLSGDVAGKLIQKANDLEEQQTLLNYMVIHNDFFCPVLDDNGNPILDDEGQVLLGDWKYEYA